MKTGRTIFSVIATALIAAAIFASPALATVSVGQAQVASNPSCTRIGKHKVCLFPGYPAHGAIGPSPHASANGVGPGHPAK